MNTRFFLPVFLFLFAPVFAFLAGCGSDTTTTTSSSSSSGTGSAAHSVPNDAHFEVTSDTYVLDWKIVGSPANIGVYLADRFGNGPVVQGTKASFYAESGATEAISVAADSVGVASVIFRAQAPAPRTVSAAAWETTLLSRVLTEYGISTTNHPSNGWGSLLVTVTGEEAFDDANGNGAYDSSESFTDTIPEPFTDYNDNGQWDVGEYFVDADSDGVWDTGESFTDTNANGTRDTGESYVDANGNGKWDRGNGQWDSSKLLYREIKIINSGAATTPTLHYAFNKSAPYTNSTFTVAASGSQKFKVLVADGNLNPLISGSTVNVALTGAGTLSSISVLSSSTTSTISGATKTYTFTTNPVTGPVEFEFSVLSGGSTGAATITVTITHKSVTYALLLTGTVN